MDVMEKKKDTKNSLSCINTASIQPTQACKIGEFSKSTCILNSKELYKKCDSSSVIIDSNLTSTLIDPLNIKVVKSDESNELKSSDDKTNCIEKSETQEKLEESLLTNIAVGVAPAIGIPLARSSPISREFVALQRSLNESKILTEFVTDTTAVKAARKGRKSQFLNSGNRENSLNKNTNRSRSDPLDISNEERYTIKRSNMRSQNSEFAQKHMDFLSRVIQQQQSGDEQYASETEDVDRCNISTADDEDERHTNVSTSSVISSDLALQDYTSLETRLKGIWQSPPKRGWDSFCWRCRECAGPALIPCSKCLRCFHKHCIKVSSTTKLDNSWNCPECLAVENVLSSPKKARRSELTLEMLSDLLSFALKRMRTSKGNSKFIFVDSDLSSFSKYIVNPVTFATLEEKIAKKAYRCPEEFYIETKWMVHNAHILTSGLSNNKLVVTAKSIVKVCRQEVNEIETCAGCYLSANTRSDWFVDVCAQPHLLLWAKLKGFPYWPAKAMGIGQNAVVNVRFFGKHDRAFVPIKDCFLFSEQDPNTQTSKRSARELADCIKEVEIHIKKIEAKVGKFCYAPFKTLYDPTEEQQQLELMMPGVTQYMKRQQAIVLKPSLQYKIVKTADNNLSIIKKANSVDSGNDDVETTHDLAENIRKESIKASTSSSSDSSKHITSKYEVITKTGSNDSNSPKVNAVILKKRKSLNFANINTDVDEKNVSEIETPSAKISKSAHNSPSAMKMPIKSGTESSLSVSKQSRMEIDANLTGVSTNSQHAVKRKQEVAELSLNEDNDGSSEKHKAKHSRSEPRLPIITIKAGSAKIVETTAREVAENFAKSNTCVTIKKIHKLTSEEMDTTTSNTCSNSRATRSSVKDMSVGSPSTVQNTTKEKNNPPVAPISLANKSTAGVSTESVTNLSPPSGTSQAKTDKDKCQSQIDRNIFRELVPFVEIKQEVNSDEEAEIIVPNAQDIAPKPVETTQVSNTGPRVQDIPAQEQNKGENMDPLLTRVKEEAISDDDTMSADLTSVQQNTIQGNTTDLPTKDMCNTIAPVAVTGPNLSDRTICVVGDTTIQRVSTRNSAIASTSVSQSTSQITPTSTTTTIFVSTSSSSSSTSPNVVNIANTTQTKRGTNRTSGIPFGPLPASATSISTKLPNVTAPKISAVTDNTIQLQHNLQQQQMQQIQSQRARKSFPNRSPPRVGTSSFPAAPVANTLPGTGLSVPVTTNPVGEIKRGGMLKSTSMVSIPADIAAQRNINQNSIPMPPLTAVSKTTPIISSITNSIAVSNSPSSSPNSNASLIGTITPAPFANTGNTSISKSNNSNTQQSTTLTMATSNQSQKMTAPPPLAGLSYANVNSAVSSPAAQLQPSVLPVTNIPLPSGSNANLPVPNTDTNSSNATENHLLGDFVTPALANAITDVICRGPPKMARRPNGPLQSDGSTMFPSGAGPICRTLVQNAHKLTDFFISVMEDTMCDMSNSDEPSLQAKITLLTMELERLKQAHEQEIAELKRTSDLMLCEMRKSMENEKTRIANEIRKQCELERLRCVEEAKRKQWCANCGREAQFYCCWNTSYCDYPCQQQHWGRHASTCAQTRNNDAPSTITSSPTMGNTQPVLSTPSTINTQAFNTEMRNKMSTINPGSMNINIQYNKNVSNSKKDKQNTVSSAGSLTGANKSSMSITIPSNNSVTSDALKLPTNTYLRPVVPISNSSNTNNNSRSSGFNSTAPSRYNIALPLKSSVNPTTPYTIVQRGSSWELLTTSSNTTPINTVNTVNSLAGVQSANSTLTSIPSGQQQQRSATMPTIINKVAGRNRGVSNMGYTSHSNGNMRATKM